MKKTRRWPWILLGVFICLFVLSGISLVVARRNKKKVEEDVDKYMQEYQNSLNETLEKYGYSSGSSGVAGGEVEPSGSSGSSVNSSESSVNSSGSGEVEYSERAKEFLQDANDLNSALDEYIEGLENVKTDPSNTEKITRCDEIGSRVNQIRQKISGYKDSELQGLTKEQVEELVKPIQSKNSTVSKLEAEVKEILAKQSSSGMREEFKKFMDDYEKFVDEYVTFMTNYQSGKLSMNDMLRYSDMTLKYAETAKKVEDLKDDDLTKEELDYYIEVTARVAKKLNGVAYSLQ